MRARPSGSEHRRRAHGDPNALACRADGSRTAGQAASGHRSWSLPMSVRNPVQSARSPSQFRPRRRQVGNWCREAARWTLANRSPHHPRGHVVQPQPWRLADSDQRAATTKVGFEPAWMQPMAGQRWLLLLRVMTVRYADVTALLTCRDPDVAGENCTNSATT
jgi:hypothetical protein